MELRIIVPLIVGITLAYYDQCAGSNDEERLARDLLLKYNKLIRPVKRMNDTVTVQFTLILSLLISVQEKEQVMKTNVWLEFMWLDPAMTWDPADYGGIQTIRLPVDKIWIPDIVLINNADGKYLESYRSNVVIYSDGNMLWLPPSIYKSTCDIKVALFPFDEQVCDMKFQSWTYNADEVTLVFKPETNHEVDQSNYQLSGTWDVVKALGFLNGPYRKSTNEPKMIDITYKIVIRRKTLFYTINLLIPTVLVSFLSVLVFYLPTVAGEKVALSISILLTLNVFLLLVSKLLPPAEELPLIGKFLLFTFLMNLVSIVVTVITININFRSPKTHTMPTWIRKIFLGILPRLLLMRRPRKPKRSKPYRYTKDEQGNHRPEPRTYTRSASPGVYDAMEMAEFRSHTAPRSLPPGGLAGPSTSNSMPGFSRRSIGQRTASDHYLARHESEDADDVSLNSPDARLVTSSIEYLVEHHLQNDAIQEVEDDWKYVALVVDRLLLWIFFLATTVGSFTILLSAETIFVPLDDAKKRDYPYIFKYKSERDPNSFPY